MNNTIKYTLLTFFISLNIYSSGCFSWQISTAPPVLYTPLEKEKTSNVLSCIINKPQDEITNINDLNNAKEMFYNLYNLYKNNYFNNKIVYFSQKEVGNLTNLSTQYPNCGIKELSSSVKFSTINNNKYNSPSYTTFIANKLEIINYLDCLIDDINIPYPDRIISYNIKRDISYEQSKDKVNFFSIDFMYLSETYKNCNLPKIDKNSNETPYISKPIAPPVNLENTKKYCLKFEKDNQNTNYLIVNGNDFLKIIKEIQKNIDSYNYELAFALENSILNSIKKSTDGKIKVFETNLKDLNITETCSS
ncbi:MAG: hypothetical protein U0457_14405 [Candidatus Sericytochromatia bacterium]